MVESLPGVTLKPRFGPSIDSTGGEFGAAASDRKGVP